MTPAGRLFICDSPTEDIWNLGPLEALSGHCLLVGWASPLASIDAGVPTPVAQTLAKTLVALAPVTFIAPPDLAEDGDARLAPGDRTFAASMRDSGWLSLVGTLTGRRPLIMVSTARADLAALVFDEPGWSRQGQVAILGAVDESALDRDVVDDLAGTEWQATAERLRKAGLSGFFKPGVDGDVALLVLTNADGRIAAIDRLLADAAAHGLAADVVTEDVLRLGLAGPA